jgi:hypothetical protein
MMQSIQATVHLWQPKSTLPEQTRRGAQLLLRRVVQIGLCSIGQPALKEPRGDTLYTLPLGHALYLQGQEARTCCNAWCMLHCACAGAWRGKSRCFT